MVHMNHQRYFDALFTVCNELKFIVHQKFTFTKTHTELRGMLGELKLQFDRLGCPELLGVFTDNLGDKNFLESVFTFVGDSGGAAGGGSSRYPPLQLPEGTAVLVLDTYTGIQNAMLALLEFAGRHGSPLVVGVDCEWDTIDNPKWSNSDDPVVIKQGKVATLQIYRGDTKVATSHTHTRTHTHTHTHTRILTRTPTRHIRTLQTAYFVHLAKVSGGRLPPALRQFLASRDVLKVGKQIGGDAALLSKDWDLTLVNYLELGAYSRSLHPRVVDGRVGLKELVRIVCRKTMAKDSSTGRLSSKWSSSNFSLAESKAMRDYAVLDAYAGWLVYTAVTAVGGSPPVQLLNEQFMVGTQVTLRQAEGGTLVAVGELVSGNEVVVDGKTVRMGGDRFTLVRIGAAVQSALVPAASLELGNTIKYRLLQGDAEGAAFPTAGEALGQVIVWPKCDVCTYDSSASVREAQYQADQQDQQAECASVELVPGHDMDYDEEVGDVWQGKGVDLDGEDELDAERASRILKDMFHFMDKVSECVCMCVCGKPSTDPDYPLVVGPAETAHSPLVVLP